MPKPTHISVLCYVLILALATYTRATAQDASQTWMKDSQARLVQELVAKHGEAQQKRLMQGMKQVSEFWRAEDGNATAFEEFVRTNFAGDQTTLDVMFNRFQYLLEQLNGHMAEIGREFRQQSDLDMGPIYPYDEVFAGYAPAAHITDDFFKNKLAFVVLLNFPITTLEQRLAEGDKWSRRQWAESRLVQRFSKRVPAEVNLALSEATAVAEQYISEYNIYMHHLVDAKGERLFPPKLRLLSHWNLRDELKANYANKTNGLAKQRMIQKVMERIVTQTIPAVVVNNPNVDWNPVTNDVKPTTVKDVEMPEKVSMPVTNAAEPDTRYAVLLKTFLASRKLDPYSPTAPTLIARRFDEDREIPEARVKQMLEAALSSQHVARVARIIEQRLGRPLEAFDIWYNGFRPRGQYSEQQLNDIVSKKYPTADAFKADIPAMLMKIGFTGERADYISRNIVVDPARGSGHALGAEMRSAKVHLRTRVDKGGMNYKGYNIAVHEMGHNVEQTLSLNDIDHYFLNGVPNTAFTEAIAYVFQTRDLELLGLASPESKDEALNTLNDFWQLYEIAGVSLVDMGIWHWMYDHPMATPAELKDAVVRIAKEVWNKYYAPVFKVKDSELLAIYSHIIHSFLYLPDYAIAHLISHQIEEYVNGKQSIGAEVERMVKIGRIAPDLWMKNATGSPLGAEGMLAATARALKEYEKQNH
jgi:hypothetical protein